MIEHIRASLVRYRRFILFCFVGGVGLLVNLAISYALTEYAGLWYFFSFIIATLVAWTVMFFLNSHVTFKGHSKENYFKRYITYITGYTGAFFVNAALVFILTSIMNIYYIISIIVAAVITTIITFSFSKSYVYHDQ